MKTFKFEIQAYTTVEVEGENAEDARMSLVTRDLSELMDTQDWSISDGREVK